MSLGASQVPLRDTLHGHEESNTAELSTQHSIESFVYLFFHKKVQYCSIVMLRNRVFTVGEVRPLREAQLMTVLRLTGKQGFSLSVKQTPELDTIKLWKRTNITDYINIWLIF